MKIIYVALAGFALLVPFVFLSPSPSIPKPPPDPVAEARFQKTVRVASVIKQSMRDPESLMWETLTANNDATVVCAEYRARNGFGGMNKEFAVYANGKVSQKTQSWNKHCTKSMFDMMHVEYALR